MERGRRRFFFEELEITSPNFSEKENVNFGFEATRIIISNDTKNKVEFSFLKDGNQLDGILYEKDGPISFEGCGEGRAWFRCVTGKPTKVRIWAWGKS